LILYTRQQVGRTSYFHNILYFILFLLFSTLVHYSGF